MRRSRHGSVPTFVLLALVASGALPAGESATRGREIFLLHCEACHGAGIGRHATEALERRYHGSVPAVLSDRSDLTPEYVRTIVRKGISYMPPFRKTEISDAELSDLGAYLARSGR